MKPLGATALALVGAVVFAGATAQLGAAKDFPDPRWTFAPSNNQFLVYACDGSDTDCTKRGPTTEGAAEKAHVYCSHPTRLDKNGLLEWTRSTFRLGGDDEVFKTFETFSVVQAAGKWASVPSPEEEYTTGTGGWVFSSISCGTGVAAPIGEGEDVMSVRFAIARSWKRPNVPGVRLLTKIKIRGNLEYGGEIGKSQEVRRPRPGRRQVFFADKGSVSGIVRVIQTYRRCLDAVCDVKRIFKRTTWIRANKKSTGIGTIFKHKDGVQKTTQMRVRAGEVVKTQSPGCKTGAASRNAFVAHLVRHSFRRGGKLIFQNTVVVKFCGEFAGADDLQARANGMVVFRVRDTGEQPLPTERRPSLAEMG